MPRFDAILFDFDGTLFDTIPLIVDSYQKVYFEMFGDEHSVESIVQGIGLPLEEVFERDYPGHVEELLAAYTKYNHEHLHHVAVFLGVIPMLEALKAEGIPLGIVSAKRMDALRPTMEQFEITDIFDVVVSKFDTTKHKPDPAPLNLAMAQLGLKDPKRILYVGDAVYDIQAAKNGGFQSAAVAWSPTPQAVLIKEAPDFILEKASDLVALSRG